MSTPFNPHNLPATGTYGLPSFRAASAEALRRAAAENTCYVTASWVDGSGNRGWDVHRADEHTLRGARTLAFYPDGLVTPNTNPTFLR